MATSKKPSNVLRSSSDPKRAILIGPAIQKQDRTFLKKKLLQLRIQKSDWLLGVDGGAQFWLELGVVPNYAVGDWDSLSPRSFKRLKDTPKETLSQDKLRSDLHYAIQSASRVGVSELICLGVTGGRPDHHLASLYELANASRQSPLRSVTAFGPEGDYHFFSDFMPQPLRLSLKKATLLSILPVLEEAQGLSLSGFRYPMNNGLLSFSSHGLSNVVSKTPCEIQLRSGCVVVMIPTEQK